MDYRARRREGMEWLNRLKIESSGRLLWTFGLYKGGEFLHQLLVLLLLLTATVFHPSNGPTAHIGPCLLFFLRFRNSSFLWCWVVSPTPNPQPVGPGLRVYDPRDRVAQLYPRALGSSGTLGVPLPVPTIVGPWGGHSIILYYYLGRTF
jgi:hypothetical protein